MVAFSTREQIVETVNKLFVYTDQQDWGKLQSQVFTNTVHLDMSSLGGDVSDLTADAICEMWRAGFEDLDAVNHLAGNYLVTINQDQADVFAYATATHFKASATNGKTREFVGTYNINLKKLENGWRITSLKYNLKYTTGNSTLD